MIIAAVTEGFKITQNFGGNESIYAKFGLKGHNGQDIGTPIGTKVYAPFDGKVEVRDSGKEGYGLHIRLTEDHSGERRQCVLAHLDSTVVDNWSKVKAGSLLGYSGNTGNSFGPHLHWGLRRLNKDGTVKNYNNGYFGYEDIFEKKWINQYLPSKY